MPLTNPESAPLKAGDKVRHPFREEDVPVAWVGTQIYRFTPKAYAGSRSRTGSYEAIDGSPQFQELDAQSGFVKELVRSEPSAEIDISSDIEKRTLVVPIDRLQRA